MENVENGFSRRNFVTGGAAALAALGGLSLLGGCSPQTTSSSSQLLSDTGTFDAEADVVVIGCGTSLGAILAAADAGASVIALEKTNMLGGQWSINSGAIWAPDTEPMKALGMNTHEETGEPDSLEVAKQEWIINSKNIYNETLLDASFQNAQKLINNLYAEGHQFEVATGHGVPGFRRCHYLLDENGQRIASGSSYTTILQEKIASNDNITIVKETAGTGLITDENGSIIGVEAVDMTSGKPLRYGAKAVIVASGGYGSDLLLRSIFNPEANGWTEYAGWKQSTGEGLRMLLGAGATIGGLTPAQGATTVETSSQKAPFTCNDKVFEFFKNPRSLITVNSDGTRHYDETEIFIHVPLDKLSSPYYLVFDETQLNEEDFTLVALWDHDEVLSAVSDGRVATANDLTELAQALYADVDTVTDTIERFNSGAQSGQDEFSRAATSMRPLNPPYYVATCELAFGSGNMVAVSLNDEAQVVTGMGRPIDGLYAGGSELTQAYNIRGPIMHTGGTLAGLGYGLSVYIGEKAAEYALARQ